MPSDLEFDILFLAIKLGINDANLREMYCLVLDFEQFSIFLCDINFTKAFKWTGFAKEPFKNWLLF